MRTSRFPRDVRRQERFARPGREMYRSVMRSTRPRGSTTSRVFQHRVPKAWVRHMTTRILGNTGLRRWTMPESLSDAAFQAVVDQAPDAILVVGDEGRIVFANAQVEELFGYARSELLGQRVEVLVPE